jgi:hypothetical protein
MYNEELLGVFDNPTTPQATTTMSTAISSTPHTSIPIDINTSESPVIDNSIVTPSEFPSMDNISSFSEYPPSFENNIETPISQHSDISIVTPTADHYSLTDLVSPSTSFLSTISATATSNETEIVSTGVHAESDQTQEQHGAAYVTEDTTKEGHKCDTCGKHYKTKSSLSRHIKLHTNTGQECVVCKKVFRDNWTLKQHIDSVHQKNTLNCNMCMKTFLTKSGLTSHVRQHEGQFRHICPMCGKGFQYKTTFEAHVATHTNEKIYSCMKCGKSFSTTSNLKKHENVCGVTAKEYICTICHSAFKAKRYLTMHIRSIHHNPNSYQCTVCGTSFNHRGTLTNHQKIHLQIE